ncbi:MAG TPA: NAD-dependent epimerase/dehydratase family protein [Thermoanaerobaculia bacterium]|jgi:uncharacterized protein YbjT (DUF2867 family)|nr:NAD-dependent epimerase/dehydratase family protein [Thermoanaerobaculia bacterium]
MNVVLFGATGMVGQGVLRECLLDPDVQRAVTVGRAPTGQRHPKLQEIVHADLFDLSAIERDLTALDACFFTLGVTSAGMTEEQYTRITYDLTMAVAETLVRLNPRMTFVFVSGAGTDSSEHGRSMWARVKGKTENALLHMPFKSAYMFRPGFIQPMHGIRSRTKSYRVFYAITAPLFPILRRLFPRLATTTEHLGRAMLAAAKHGAPEVVLDTAAINRLSATIAPA